MIALTDPQDRTSADRLRGPADKTSEIACHLKKSPVLCSPLGPKVVNQHFRILLISH